MYSWQSFRKRFDLIGLKWPWDWRLPSRSSIVIDLIQLITFCKIHTSRNRKTTSCGNIGLDGADTMLRKSEPSVFKTRRTSVAHVSHQSKYDSRSWRSEYFR